MEFMKQYAVLFKKAKTDLKVSKNLLEDFEQGDDELDLEVIMFHLQQCSEKSLKCLLSFNKLHFTKTHDIEKLIDALSENNIKIIHNIEMLIPLGEYAVEGRYSILHDDIDDANEYIIYLDELINYIEDTLNKK